MKDMGHGVVAAETQEEFDALIADPSVKPAPSALGGYPPGEPITIREEPPPGDMTWTLEDPSGERRELLRFCRNGDIFIHGRLAENDKAVVEGMREFLQGVS